MSEEMKILIVDDRPANLLALEQTLAQIDAVVIKAGSGNEALTTCLNHRFALAILDVKMPGMDGYELAEYLRGDAKTSSLPIIFLTATYGESQQVFRGYEAGAVDYIVKPYEPIVLRGKVGVFVELERQRRELIDHREHLEALVAKRTIELETQNEELRRAQEALRVSEEHHRNTLVHLPVGVVVLGADIKIVLSNPEASRILGLSKDQMRGKVANDPDFCFLRQDGSSMPLDEYPVNTALRIGKPLQNMMVGINRPSTRDIAWVLVNAFPVFEAKGTLKRMVVSFVDITERKQLETRLAQSDRMASMGMLAAGVAHEINNPLTYMLYHMDVLNEELPRVAAALQDIWLAIDGAGGGARVRGLLESQRSILEASQLGELVDSAKWARDGGERVSQIVRDLKTFSRVEEKELEPVQLVEIVEGALSMATNEVKYRARLEKQLDEVPLVLGNAGRLSQVVLNLVVNAAQAIDEGNAEINQIVVRTFIEDDMVCVEVRDTGKGISEEHLEGIFEPFFTTKPEGVGTGLGLSICRETVTAHDGFIGVSSEAGKGTSFVVRLPRYVTTQPSEKRPTVVSEPSIPPDRRARILLVDDEEQILRALKRMLRREHDVTTTSSGAEARKVLELDRAFDAILCDMMMAEVSGVDLYEWVDEVEPALARRMIFMTGGVFTSRAMEFKSRAPNPIVHKPFQPKLLRALLREVVASALEVDVS